VDALQSTRDKNPDLGIQKFVAAFKEAHPRFAAVGTKRVRAVLAALPPPRSEKVKVTMVDDEPVVTVDDKLPAANSPRGLIKDCPGPPRAFKRPHW
jgi:hypothetical protein